MDTIFMISKNSRTPEYHVLIVNLSDKLDVTGGQKSVVLSYLIIAKFAIK